MSSKPQDNRLSQAFVPGVASVTVQQQPVVVRLNPAQINGAVPLLQALSGPGQLFEVWAVDFRDPAAVPTPPQLWLQIFDSFPAPVSGTTEPTVSALPLCSTAAYVWADDQFLLNEGLWVALSSTPLVYTALAQNQNFSLTARVLP